MNFDDFINKYLGKGVDTDNSYGCQCWDLFSRFCLDYDGVSISCWPSGYARSLWENRANNGILNYFVEVDPLYLRKGDVIIYGVCKVSSLSHVCFFVSDDGNSRTYTTFEQNYMGQQFCSLDHLPYDGIIGCFRPKQLVAPTPKPSKEPSYVGTVVDRDTTKDQIKVDVECLRVRKEPNVNSEIIGYANIGIYDYSQIINSGGFDWYNIGIGYIAYNSGWETLLPKEEPIPTPTPEPTPEPTPTPVDPEPTPSEPTEQNGWLVTLLKLILDIIKKIFTKK